MNIKYKISWLLIIGYCALITSCTNIERVDTTQVKALVENSEIKRITPADMNATVNRLGKQLTDSLNTAFMTQKDLSCDLANNALVNSLTKENNYKIRLLGAKDTTATNLYSKELDVLFAYAYNAKRGLSTESNIQKMGDSLLIYSAPANAKIAERCFNDSKNKLAVWSLVFPVGEVIKRIE
jgi:histone acetyltransferase (RNA polymerase elongator complex component)